MIARRRAKIARLRRRIHFVLDSGVSDRAAQVVHGLLIALVVVSVTSVVLETVPDLERRYGAWFQAVELVALVGFTIEYGLRLWTATESAPYFGMAPWRARLAYATTIFAIIDLATILPLYLQYVVPGDLRVLLLLRLARFFKLARYSPGMRSLIAALQAERKALGATAVGIGRPYIWGLGAFGQPGVERTLDLLNKELRLAMGGVGARTLKEITPAALIRRA